MPEHTDARAGGFGVTHVELDCVGGSEPGSHTFGGWGIHSCFVGLLECREESNEPFLFSQCVSKGCRQGDVVSSVKCWH